MLEAGHYTTLSNEDYHRDQSFSKSGIQHLKVSGQHYDLSKEPSEKKERPLIVGSAFHQVVEDAVNSTKHYQDQFIVMPDFSGKGSVALKKEWLAENADKDAITQAEQDQVFFMRDSLLKHPDVSIYLKGSLIENSFLWEDEETELMCKARPDYIRPDASVAFDLKSSASISTEEFSKSVLKYYYHCQAAMCIDGIGKYLDPITSFIFVVVEKTFPYDVKTFELSAEAIDRGREVYMYWLTQLKRYQDIKNNLDDGAWKGSEPGLVSIDIPVWGYNQY